MSEYKDVKIGKLKFKGSSSSSEKKKKGKKKKRERESTRDELPEDKDADEHGGWWSIKSYEKLTGGNVAIELYNSSYIFALDNGTLVCGKKQSDDETAKTPKEEETFTMIKISETKAAFKSGYGKYISVNAMGDILARSEAVGPQEQIEVVIQDEKVALQGHNGYFISVTDDGKLRSLSSTAKEKEMICLRTNVSRVKKKKVNEEDEGDVGDFELKYVKDFQSFQDRRIRLHEGPKSSLETARNAGKLHEAMLDRREKMKADRYCK